MKKVDVIVPVYKADKKFERMLSMLLQQTMRPAKIILMNTEAEGFTVSNLRERVEKVAAKHDRAGQNPVEIRIAKVEKKDYDHGGTRNLAVRQYSDAEFFLCMTQDVIPADVFLLEKLLECFKDEQVGAAYARQLAGEHASFTEQYLRLHNYPVDSVRKTKEDKERLGIKTYMISNACAMYRRSRYDELGGFVTDTIFNEDMIFGAGLIEAGEAILYCASAQVYHTHNYGLTAQFKRSFDLAVSQADFPEVFRKVSSEKEGLSYVKTAAEYCISQKRYGDLFVFLMDAVARYAGYFLGKHYRSLPEKAVLACTLQPAYWAKKKGLERKEVSEEEQSEREDMLAKLHTLEVDALKAFVALCEQYGLRYYAIGGTLLGAVRHQGFIPWDDDVDLAMPREDYDKLIELVESGEAEIVLGGKYRIESWQTDEEFKSYFAKVCSTEVEIYEKLLEDDTKRRGYLIDILPLDGTPDDELMRKLYYAKAMGLRFLCGTANVHTGIRTSRPKWEQLLLRVVRALGLYRLIKIRDVYRAMDNLFKKQDSERAEYAGTLTGAYKTKEIVPRVYFGETYDECSLWEFEGMTLRGPKLWEEYLTHMFGDYRELPPESERKVHYKPCIVEKGKE
ncbi:MAG: LicD family protein [Lachnospiraceae bacterium]|nr:LicD family protein [Lachnospiraceae bacterium]